MCREPADRVTDVFGLCFRDPDSVTSVGVLGWADVPSFDGMGAHESRVDG
eukprot:CAMPEP_0202452118 /NCGR_PEP_ID=MMETSP1360-20130828/10391_1 /ASSEMBLY_ACC=CAM_ASM_000848 /TAXON_ID=515479 /ORGANISM="Licmophora paradoxa, Strain CCMP2313" /LENGTH=49 /DNA_ID= /DNA_START= /DNA_END= /DNA_ORIENTATION=